MKKVMTVILAAAMCLSLAACGDTANVSSVVSDEVSSEVEEATPTAEPTPTPTPEPTPEPEILETAHCVLDGVYVDNSYVDSDNPNLKMVYACYTVSTNDSNLKVSSKLSTMNFESGNSYSSSFYSSGNTDYMASYYASSYLEEVFIGESLKVVSMFLVPSAEFENGELITLIPYGIPSGEELRISSANVQFFDSADALAEAADPEGYELEKLLHEPADEELTAKVKAEIDGYYWSFYVNSTAYQIEFYSSNTFETRVKALGVSNSGTYVVEKGYVAITYDSNGTTVEIPFSWEDGEFNLDATSAFDVKE